MNEINIITMCIVAAGVVGFGLVGLYLVVKGTRLNEEARKLMPPKPPCRSRYPNLSAAEAERLYILGFITNAELHYALAKEYGPEQASERKKS